MASPTDNDRLSWLLRIFELRVQLHETAQHINALWECDKINNGLAEKLACKAERAVCANRFSVAEGICKELERILELRKPLMHLTYDEAYGLLVEDIADRSKRIRNWRQI